MPKLVDTDALCETLHDFFLRWGMMMTVRHFTPDTPVYRDTYHEDLRVAQEALKPPLRKIAEAFEERGRDAAPLWNLICGMPTATDQIWDDAFSAVKRAETLAKMEINERESAHTEQVEKPLSHSLDYRSVRWGDKAFSFTAAQSHAVRALVEAYERGTPDIGQETLLIDCIDTTQEKLATVFRDNPAWGQMIITGATKGTFRIADPPKKKNKKI